MVDVDEGGSAGARLNEAERAEETMLAQGPLSAASTAKLTERAFSRSRRRSLSSCLTALA